MTLRPYNRTRRLALVDFVRNVGWGAAAGAAFAAVCLLVGAGRLGLALLSGATIEALTWADARLMIFYVGGFILAGAVVGALRPFLQSASAIYSAMALGGAIVMNAIAIADQGLAAMTLGDWTAMTVIGAFFGCAAAYGFLRAG